MKKFLTFVLILTVAMLSVFSFTGCSEKNETIEEKSIVIAVPEGGPALGMAYLMKHYPEKIGDTKVEYRIVSGAEGIKAAVTSGEADMAIMPTNMAATLYNKNLADIRVVGTNSYGLLYLLSDSVSAEDFSYEMLKGQVLHALGQGGTPEIVLEKILESKGIEYVESDTPVEGKVALQFHAEGSEIIGAFKQNRIDFGILGEPAATSAMQKVGAGLKIVSDLQEDWKVATDTSASYPQTSLVAKKSLIDSDPDLVKKIAELTLAGSEALLDDPTPYIDVLQNVEEGVTTVPASFTKEGVTRTHITPTFGATAKTDIEAYLTILMQFKPAVIGGKLPDAEFYYDVGIRE